MRVPRWASVSTAAAVCALWCTRPVAAQLPTHRGSVRVVAGYALKYLDEPWEFALGGSASVCLSRRFSIQPEVVVSRGRRFNQWTFVPSIALDLRQPGKRVAPYVIGGVGYFHELDKSIHYKRSEMAWNGGVGARILIGGGAFLSPEFRVGHLSRVTIGVGYLF